MTNPTAEERAREIVRKYYGELGAMEDEITQALRAERNAALEDAAKVADGILRAVQSAGVHEHEVPAKVIAQLIRALIKGEAHETR